MTLIAPKKSASNVADTTSGDSKPAIDINQLFSEHHRHLLRFVQRYLRNPEDAEDVVQNTYIEAMRCASSFSGMSKPSTWLFGIALNLARNQVRRNYAGKIDEVEESFIENIVDEHGDPAQLYELRQVVNKVQALLEELPQKIRVTFETILDGETTYEEAAQQLSVPIGTIRSRVSRVRNSMRSELQPTMAFFES